MSPPMGQIRVRHAFAAVAPLLLMCVGWDSLALCLIPNAALVLLHCDVYLLGFEVI